MLGPKVIAASRISGAIQLCTLKLLGRLTHLESTAITDHIYVDETKRRDYLLVASVHATTDLASLRAVVRGLLLPRQRYLHMKDEKDGRKRTIAEAFIAAGVKATIYRATSPMYRTERERRAACLRTLVYDHAGTDTRIVLDQDDTMLSWDNQHLIEYTRIAGCRDTLHYEHKRPHADALLAIPDAIAWCWAKGGNWQQLITPTVSAVRDV